MIYHGSWVSWREPGKSELRTITPTSSTYCIQNSSQCLCLGNVNDKFTDSFYICPMICLSKNSQPSQPQREALMKTRIISGSIWGDLNVTPIAALFTYSLQYLSCTTAPTSSTYCSQNTSQCTGQANNTNCRSSWGMSFPRSLQVFLSGIFSVASF